MRKLFLAVIIFLFLPGISPATLFNQTDTFTITTYYPAPHGVYGTMRLYPLNQPKVNCNHDFEGAMYYNATAKNIEVCRCIDDEPTPCDQ
jgi:hypothetical protein